MFNTAGFYGRRFIDVSARHITLGDCNRLDYMCGRKKEIPGVPNAELMAFHSLSLCVEPKDQGWVVFDSSGNMPMQAEDDRYFLANKGVFGFPLPYKDRARLIELGFSLAFVDLWDGARSIGFGLWLDADAASYHQLPQFDWEQEKKTNVPVLTGERMGSSDDTP